MNTISRSSSVFPYPAVSLTHSVNSSGRMGLFVDPVACSCGGCEDYCRSAPAELPAPLTPIRTPKADVSIGPPALRRITKEEAAPFVVTLVRSAANQVCIDGEWMASDSVAALAAETTSSSSLSDDGFNALCALGQAAARDWDYSSSASASALPVPARVPLRRVDAFSPAPSPALLSSKEDEMEDICSRLRYVRADLQTQQDEVYSGEARSHDEMAAQDQEFEDLDRKIMAIEQLLTAFGSFFRTR